MSESVFSQFLSVSKVVCSTAPVRVAHQSLYENFVQLAHSPIIIRVCISGNFIPRDRFSNPLPRDNKISSLRMTNPSRLLLRECPYTALNRDGFPNTPPSRQCMSPLLFKSLESNITSRRHALNSFDATFQPLMLKLHHSGQRSHFCAHVSPSAVHLQLLIIDATGKNFVRFLDRLGPSY